MKDYIEERVLEIAKYIVREKATVRQAAGVFGVSKSTVHTVLIKWNEYKRLISLSLLCKKSSVSNELTPSTLKMGVVI